MFEQKQPRLEQPAVQLQPRIREVVHAHGGFVYRSLRDLGVGEADVDDAMQDVFLVVSRRLTDYEERGRVRSWLYSICTRVARSQRRKLLRRRKEHAVTHREEATGPTQFEHIQHREALRLGYQLLDRLPPQQREVFLLYEVEDMPMSEIARALNCHLQTAYSRLYSARERILAAAERIAAEREAGQISPRSDRGESRREHSNAAELFSPKFVTAG